jgi:AhpD family alkylhydroperoxidase
VRRAAAIGLVDRVYGQIEADFGMLAPPMALHAAAPEVLAAFWMIARETLVVEGAVDRATKEAVSSAVSFANTCPYCVEVHTVTLVGLRRRDLDATVIAAGQFGAVTDPRLRGLVEWARDTGLRNGETETITPFPPEQAAELIGTVCAFHYINRMVNVFLSESPLPALGPALGLVRRRAAGILRRLASTRVEPGRSLEFLDDATPPPDLSWASGRPTLYAAWARAAGAIEAAGERSVPSAVRDLVRTCLADQGPGPGIAVRAWVDQAVSALPEPQRPAARLALLVGFASYQVTPRCLDEVRTHDYDDRALVELTSWASFTAARRIGALLSRERPGRDPLMTIPT